MNAESKGPEAGYAPVNGLRMYHELHGEARAGRVPLVLLHGGGDTIGTSFGKILPLLARGRRVVAVEQQGHGHTADIADRPFTFEQSADDTAALLRHLGIAGADVLGFSNGGTVALQLAIRHAGLVRRIIPVSTFFSRAGAPPAFWESMQNPPIEAMPPELKAAYLRVAPRPEDFPTFFAKAARRMRDFKDLPEADLRRIAAPALVINADADVVLPEHAVALMRLLPRAQLAIVPGADHMGLMSRTEVLVPMIEAFLDRT
ncbi:MAG TPA: alpha/beta hydrolase [Opitutaceae bacterium]|nr:alpha/beta hydrolase [Opitutaceae bacterium]